jgi:fructose-1,6-bisphosphatase class 3
MKRDLDYLRLLAKSFPSANKTAAEVINLRAICALPKGTEYFFSDLHGESEAFIFLLRSASGVIRAKIAELFTELSNDEQLRLANLVYYPRESFQEKGNDRLKDMHLQKAVLHYLSVLCLKVASKYTRSKVRKKLPKEFAYAIEELLYPGEEDTDLYHKEILEGIVDVGRGKEFIIALCELIQNLSIDCLHIIGDIYDRGARPDRIMEELLAFHDVDIQWGNHDVDWMGASSGNPACIANVLRIAISYNNFDMLEDGYGINIRPLSMLAQEIYGEDPCTFFYPHLWDENVADSVEPALAAKMCKMISVIQWKEEGQLIRRHPEYGLSHRMLLHKIHPEKAEVEVEGIVYPMRDCSFPTVDWKDPYQLSEKEQELMDTLIYSFTHSKVLKRHMDFFFSHGGMYKVVNHNILFHGCIPMTEGGDFLSITTRDGKVAGKRLLDYCEQKCREAYFMNAELDPNGKRYATDFFWYLWCGPKSPLFGKDKMSSFEHCFIADPESHKERYNAYYRWVEKESYVDRIIEEFHEIPALSHIVNGHVPVKSKNGESPVKANGKVFVIDGGISKAYHSKTGIAGYTLIYDSKHLSLAEHRNFQKGEENTPCISVVERMKNRIRIGETDKGIELKEQMEDLLALLEAYQNGEIKEELH